MAKDDLNVAIFEAYGDEASFDPVLPERNLMRAILLSAMSDLRKNGDLGRKAREFFASVDEHYLYSFRSICNHLEVDPRSILIVTGLRAPRRTGGDTLLLECRGENGDDTLLPIEALTPREKKK